MAKSKLKITKKSRRANGKGETSATSISHYVNTYHNSSAPPKPTERSDWTAFYNAADPVLVLAAELTRVVTGAHQGAATIMADGDWSQARKYFSLSEKYAKWADYDAPTVGSGIHEYLIKNNQANALDPNRIGGSFRVAKLRIRERQASSDERMACNANHRI